MDQRVNNWKKDISTPKTMLEPPRVDGIPEGEPSAIKDGSSNIDKNMSESHHCKINQDDATFVLSLLDDSKEDVTTDRKRQLHVDPNNGVTKSFKECIRKADCNHNAIKILKITG